MAKDVIPEVRIFDEVKRHILGPVLVPERFDRHGDAMTSNEIEFSCHYYNENHLGRCDREHDQKILSCAKIIESYILEFPVNYNGVQLPAGTWMVKVAVDKTEEGETIWQQFLSGELQGFSPDGDCMEHKIIKDEENVS